MTAADAIKILMAVWDAVKTAVRKAFPDLTEDEVYEIAKDITLRKLGIHHSTGELK